MVLPAWRNNGIKLICAIATVLLCSAAPGCTSLTSGTLHGQGLRNRWRHQVIIWFRLWHVNLRTWQARVAPLLC
jgi:hypothetical protein